MRIAYLVNSYPLPSQTFIRREIHALERLGLGVERLAMRPPATPSADPGDAAEAARTTHLLARGLLPLLLPGLGYALRHPRRALRALRLAMACGRRGAGGAPGTGGRLRHLVYWLEAAVTARHCQRAGIRHIHAHFGTNSATVAMLATQIGGGSYSFTVHGPEEFDATRAHSLAEKCMRAAFVIAISSYGRAQLCRWVDHAYWGKIHVVHCGIEPAVFPAPAPLPKGPLQLVAIGRMAEQKGFGLLVEAMAMVPEVRLALVGDGPFRPALQAQIAAAGLADRITLPGWSDEAGVRAALAQAHALVLPSFAEGLPMVVMEAFAAGRPVIATWIAGVPELVTPDCGLLVPAGDAGALAAAIRQMAAMPRDILAQMGAAGRVRALKRHDVDSEAGKLAALFAGVG